MQPIRTTVLCVLLAMAALSTAEAQRAGSGRGSPGRPPATIPALGSDASTTGGVFEVLSVRAADGVMRLRGQDGKIADVHVQEHVYDLSKLKAGDKVKVDFFQPEEGETRVRAAGVWPAE
jgi:hypothetical protein